MAKYKLIEVIKTIENENTNESQSLYDFDDKEQGITKLYNDFGVAIKQNNVLSAYCILIDNTTGKTECNLHYPFTALVVAADEWFIPPIRDRVYTHNDYADDNISAYDNERLATGNFYTKIASARNNPKCNFAIVIKINGIGDYGEESIYKFERNT